MIVYKMQENGRATDFQYWSDKKPIPDGFKKACDGDKIPEDLTPYHEQRYLDYRKLEDQRKICVKLLNDSECKVSNDPPYPADVPKWEEYRKELRAILKSNTLSGIPVKPFG